MAKLMLNFSALNQYKTWVSKRMPGNTEVKI